MVPRGFLNGGGSGWDTDDLLPPTSAPWDLNLEGVAINPPFSSHSHKSNDEPKPSSFANFSGNNRRDGDPAPAVANAFLPGDGDESGGSHQLNDSQAPEGPPSPTGQVHDATETPYIFSADEWSSFLHSLPPAPGTQPLTTQGWTAYSSAESTAQDVNLRKPMPSPARPSKMTPDPPRTRRRTAATPSKETSAGNGSQASTVETGETASPKARPASNVRKKQERTPLRKGQAGSRSSQAEEDLPKETSVPQLPEDSVTSGSQSGLSRSNFEFNKLDQLEQSLRTPGVIRAGQQIPVQHGQPSLPNEKGFSIQIGSALFKLSGASIMSDGRFSKTFE